MARYKNINGERIPLTAEEETKRDAEEQAWNDASAERKLSIIKEYRLNKLTETDWWVLRGNMTDAQSTYRQNLRNIPQDYTTEEQYDLLLARETDKTKDNFGQLTHTVWEKP